MGNYRNTYFDNNASNHGWYTCVRCGKKLRKGDADIDHIIPQSYGGSDDEVNLQCLCVHCNRSKRDDTSDSFSDLARSTGRIAKREVEKNPITNFLFKKRF